MPAATKPRPRKRPAPPPAPEPPAAEQFIPPDDDFTIPEPEERHRTPKWAKLESDVASLYIMVGGTISTLPEQVAGTRFKMVGVSLARERDVIAAAWIDLAEDDKQVARVLESLTSFSGWGKVVGVHLMAVGGAIPGIAGAFPQPEQPQPQTGNGGGLDPQAAQMIADLIRQNASAARAEQAVPIFAEPIPQPPVQGQPLAPQEQQPQVVRQPVAPGQTRPGRNAGIPSAADLLGAGAIPDSPMDFPSAGSENIRG